MQTVVPEVSPVAQVLRLKPGSQVVGRVGSEVCVALLHWVNSRSLPCASVKGACRLCDQYGAPQWAAFLSLRVNRSTRLLQVGARGLTKSGVEDVRDLVGWECRFLRPPGRRFVVVEQLGQYEPVLQLPTSDFLRTLWGLTVKPDCANPDLFDWVHAQFGVR